MRRFFTVVIFSVVGLSMASAESEADRVESAASVMNEIMSTPDKGIPEEILASAKCVAVVPSMLKGGLGFGGAYGRGVATCRTEKGWSAPAPFSIKGGSLGLQIGGKMRAEVLTYSRARGLFAGVSINGAVVSQDKDATRELFGRMVPFKTILTGAVETPQPGEVFVAAVTKATPKKP